MALLSARTRLADLSPRRDPFCCSRTEREKGLPLKIRNPATVVRRASPARVSTPGGLIIVFDRLLGMRSTVTVSSILSLRPGIIDA